ncbi:hypothetical protein As57867_022910, partial [Aphanomyces stellatus]
MTTSSIVAAIAALALQAASAQKINGWYPCSIQTFASPTPNPTSSSSSASSSVADEQIHIPGGVGMSLDEPNKISAIFRSLLLPSDLALRTATGAPSVECAEFTMPLCHDAMCASNATVKVFVKRMLAQSRVPAPKALWVLQGGPGASSVNMESIMSTLYDAPGSSLGGSVDIYTMDHRGTGRSSKLSCVATQIETSGSPTKGQVTSDNFPACVKDINTQLSDDGDANLLRGYSTTAAATDLSKMISILDTSASGQTYVYGVSYGTYLVERLMQLANPSIKGYVLDGVVSQSGSKSGQKLSFADWAANTNEVGEGFLTACAKDPACGAHFPTTNAKDTLRSVLSAMDKNPSSSKCSQLTASGVGTGTPPSVLVRSVLSQLLQVQAARSLIPALIYRLSRCNAGDITAIANFFTAYVNIFGGTDESDAYDSTMLYNLVALSELFTYPTPSRASLVASYLNTTIA